MTARSRLPRLASTAVTIPFPGIGQSISWPASSLRRVDAELAVGVRKMRLHGVDRQVLLVADFPVCPPARASRATAWPVFEPIRLRRPVHRQLPAAFLSFTQDQTMPPGFWHPG